MLYTLPRVAAQLNFSRQGEAPARGPVCRPPACVHAQGKAFPRTSARVDVQASSQGAWGPRLLLEHNQMHKQGQQQRSTALPCATPGGSARPLRQPELADTHTNASAHTCAHAHTPRTHDMQTHGPHPRLTDGVQVPQEQGGRVGCVTVKDRCMHACPKSEPQWPPVRVRGAKVKPRWSEGEARCIICRSSIIRALYCIVKHSLPAPAPWHQGPGAEQEACAD